MTCIIVSTAYRQTMSRLGLEQNLRALYRYATLHSDAEPSTKPPPRARPLPLKHYHLPLSSRSSHLPQSLFTTSRSRFACIAAWFHTFVSFDHAAVTFIFFC
jgi:hypothetical protein